MSRLSLLLVLLVVLTAGCNGISSGTSAPDREPYGVDEPLESSLATPGANVAGLTEEGFQNDSFVRDHHEVLKNQSYATAQTTTATLSNGTVVLENEQSMRIDAANRRSLRHTQTTGSWNLDVRETDRQRDTAQYRSENDQFAIGQPVVRIEHGNGTVEYDRGYDTSLRMEVYNHISPLRDAEELEIVRETYADGRYTVVTGTDPAADSVFLDDEPFTVRAYIRDDGLIRYVTVEAAIRRNGERVHIAQEFVVEDIGEVSVERPDWYEEAREELDKDDLRTPEPEVEE